MAKQGSHKRKKLSATNSQVVPDVRNRSVDGDLVADEGAEAVVDVGRHRLVLLLGVQLDRSPIFTGSLPPQVSTDSLPIVPVDLRAQVGLRVHDGLKDQ